MPTGHRKHESARGSGEPAACGGSLERDRPQSRTSADPPDSTPACRSGMLHDRVLVGWTAARASGAPPLASSSRRPRRSASRLSWATAVGVGPNVRSIVVGDRVLFDPDDRSEVELHGREYVLLRERDVHAVAAERVETDATGLYL